MIRINKYIAMGGTYSRRSAEELIANKKVFLNGKLVTNLATMVDENNDTVTIEGKPVSPINKKIYVMLHKPKGYITTLHDDKDRPTVMNFFPDFLKRVVKPVGRLDRESEGLLLFTNDGEFSKTLTHPSSRIKKYYQVTIEGDITKDELNILNKGVEIDVNGEKEITHPIRVKVISTDPVKKTTKLEVIIAEGKNREIRKMFAEINKVIVLLKRTQIGKLTLGGLPRGKYKDFKPELCLNND